MSDLAIKVQGLGKRYFIGGEQNRFRKTLRESLTDAVLSPFRPREQNTKANAFWALKDVDFEIKRGDVVGIIGRNGAGKSTLLKILSRITDPTEGEIEINGRVGSLLEVGTGFHHELTGRENVYLNGAILGMKRADIERKFDEIVAFAGTEKFLDTPVKFYSSGMYMRLAFAVAAHLEPEILIVDEVLAVGDAEFQEKCLGKMNEVARDGRTVLFVSHNMNAVRTLCNHCIWLVKGQRFDEGDPKTLVGRYLAVGQERPLWTSDDPEPRLVQNEFFMPTRFALVDQNMQVLSGPVGANETVGVMLEGDAEALNGSLSVGFAIYAMTGELICWSQQSDTDRASWPPIEVGRNRLVAWLPRHFLNEGEYRIELMTTLHFQRWFCEAGVNAPSVRLQIKGGLSESPHWIMARPGLMAPIIPFIKLDSR
jgi:lipopolysaccharide transport system ATP-binding protein